MKKMIEDIDAATDLALAKGLRVMQTHYFGKSQAAHVKVLLDNMRPPMGAHIVDAGSGVGEIPLILSTLRPDLRFTLVNVSLHQLEQSPEGQAFEPVLADFTASGIDPESVDVVMFNSALCQMPINQALAEAFRVLKPGGILFVSDLSLSGYHELPQIHATFMSARQWSNIIRRHGFNDGNVMTFAHSDMSHFQDAYGETFKADLPGADPFIGRFRKAKDPIGQALARHEKVAFQLSGGKDSIAALYLMRPYWDKMTVYWTNTGDAVPEVRDVIERIRAEVPHFQEITGRVHEQIAAHGIPSDIVPTSATPIGLSSAGAGVAIQDRFQCCYNSLMLPMQERMEADGVTMIVRGQKTADKLKSPYRSGALERGIELLFPIETWTDAQVFDWLETNAFVPGYYADLGASPDCLTCSAYWGERRSAWLKDRHPDAYAVYQGRMNVIRAAVMPHIELFNLEVE
jgi:ubiquinone/menaquinone biosynthesis C-methylase UbiE/3'-phosphoadenosine 5'-phosphosulfate sulfotransferase (PAPS reductase)/FAD synthetase